MADQQQKCISHSFGESKFKIKMPAWPDSGEGLLLGCRRLTSLSLPVGERAVVSSMSSTCPGLQGSSDCWVLCGPPSMEGDGGSKAGSSTFPGGGKPPDPWPLPALCAAQPWDGETQTASSQRPRALSRRWAHLLCSKKREAQDEKVFFFFFFFLLLRPRGQRGKEKGHNYIYIWATTSRTLWPVLCWSTSKKNNNKSSVHVSLI